MDRAVRNDVRVDDLLGKALHPLRTERELRLPIYAIRPALQEWKQCLRDDGHDQQARNAVEENIPAV